MKKINNEDSAKLIKAKTIAKNIIILPRCSEIDWISFYGSFIALVTEKKLFKILYFDMNATKKHPDYTTILAVELSTQPNSFIRNFHLN